MRRSCLVAESFQPSLLFCIVAARTRTFLAVLVEAAGETPTSSSLCISHRKSRAVIHSLP